jgi:SRSO17 transposase
VKTNKDHEVAACGSVAVEAWFATVGEVWLDWFASVFARVEVRRTARSYVEGLLSTASRKNCWWLAQEAGHATPGRMQHLLAGARWDADRLRGALLAMIAARVAVPGGVLIVDETGFAKKGTGSVGVARQYSGTLGRVDNCQIGVFLTYATSSLRILADRVLYLPKAWTDDRDRCQRAGVPADVAFATKAQLALVMIGRAVTAGLAAAWVTADEAYGGDHKFRAGIRALGLNYVVAVARDQRVTIAHIRLRVDVAVAALPAAAWQRYSCGPGSKGPRWYLWAWIGLETTDGSAQSVLVRRSDNGTLAYYLTCTTGTISLSTLIAVAGRRWAVEETFQVSKDSFGLDEYQTRSWDGWHRHTALVMVAAGSVVVATIDPAPTAEAIDEIPADPSDTVSVNECRRLIATIILATRHTTRDLIEHLIRWSQWRRHHQTTARAAHYRRRTAIDGC